MTPADPRLATLRHWLERHGDAVRDGDTDAVTACAAEVQRQVAALGRKPPTGADLPLLKPLLQECVRNQALLARRQQDVERSLAALRAGAPQASLPQPVYGAHGGFAGRGFGRA